MISENIKNCKLFGFVVIFTALFFSSCSKEEGSNDVSSIVVTTSKNYFYSGDNIDLKVVTNTESDVTTNSKIFIDGKQTSKPYNAPEEPGEHNIKAVYNGLSSELTIEVKELTPIKVSVDKTVFNPGEQIKVVVKTDKGEDVTADSKIFIDGISTIPNYYKAPSKPGECSIKAVYKGFGDDTKINVTKTIFIFLAVNKFTFYPGEEMKITATINSITGKDITDKVKFFLEDKQIEKPYKVPSKPGSYKFRVTYQERNNVDGLIYAGTSAQAVLKVLSVTNIPDPRFEQTLRLYGLDGTGSINDGKVLTSKIDKLTQLNVYNKGIKDLTGIEDFVSLEAINVISNQLTSLDFSKNTALTYIDCGNNQISSLKIDSNTNLTKLFCSDNQISSLKIDSNTNLTDLNCFQNRLTSLDITNNKSLIVLDCGNNPLSHLDLRNGNYRKFRSISLTGNRILKCILVDNKRHMDLYWSWAKDFFAKYIEKPEDCK